MDDESQWLTLQKMLAQRQFNRQGAPGVPGMQGGPSGRGSPWDEVPGGGSTANAVQPQNLSVKQKQVLQDLASDAQLMSMLGFGTALGSMVAGPPNPLSLAGAVGGIGVGTLGGIASTWAGDRAKKMGYQGN